VAYGRRGPPNERTSIPPRGAAYSRQIDKHGQARDVAVVCRSAATKASAQPRAQIIVFKRRLVGKTFGRPPFVQRRPRVSAPARSSRSRRGRRDLLLARLSLRSRRTERLAGSRLGRDGTAKTGPDELPAGRVHAQWLPAVRALCALGAALCRHATRQISSGCSRAAHRPAGSLLKSRHHHAHTKGSRRSPPGGTASPNLH
jgi:hypothetical protein